MLPENCDLVSFDVVNMFRNIDNKSVFLSVKEALTGSNFDVDTAQCIKWLQLESNPESFIPKWTFNHSIIGWVFVYELSASSFESSCSS